jgi:hypothetical protein
VDRGIEKKMFANRSHAIELALFKLKSESDRQTKG